MPISNFGSGLQKVLSLLPGTYGTSLIRNHMMQGTFVKMSKEGIAQNIPEENMSEVIEKVKEVLIVLLISFLIQFQWRECMEYLLVQSLY